jgi:hypothetical protein
MISRRKYLVRIAVLLISVALSLIIGEIMVRVAGLAPEIIPINTRENQAFKISSNPVLGYELRENALYSDMEHGIGNKTNSHGQWDRERKYEKPAGIRRIILLGDSIVLAGDVFEMSNGNGMSARLEKILGEDRVEVLNFGVTG